MRRNFGLVRISVGNGEHAHKHSKKQLCASTLNSVPIALPRPWWDRYDANPMRNRRSYAESSLSHASGGTAIHMIHYATVDLIIRTGMTWDENVMKQRNW